MSALIVAAAIVGGSAGAVIRFLVSHRLPVVRGHLPRGVLIVNVLGSAIGGALLGLVERTAVSSEWQYIVVSGVCGGLTTFSTWTVETIELVDGGRWRAAVLNVLVSLVLGFGMALGAYLLCR